MDEAEETIDVTLSIPILLTKSEDGYTATDAYMNAGGRGPTARLALESWFLNNRARTSSGGFFLRREVEFWDGTSLSDMVGRLLSETPAPTEPPVESHLPTLE